MAFLEVITLHYYKTTGRTTWGGWEDGQKAWLLDVNTSFIWSGINRKLHHSTGSAHSKVSVPTKRPWDAEVEGQRPVDVKAEGQRSEG